MWMFLPSLFTGNLHDLPRPDPGGVVFYIFTIDNCTNICTIGIMKPSKRKTPLRPMIGKAHEGLIIDIQSALNSSIVSYNNTDIIRLALERLWMQEIKSDVLPASIIKFHKMPHDK
jgi:hypothetical protein